MSLLTTSALIIFDCDGVLVDSEALSIRTIVDVLQRAGVPATAGLFDACFGMRMADSLRHVGTVTGFDVPAALIAEIWPATRAAFDTDLRPTPGIHDFLERTRAVPRCVASSSDPERIAHSLALTGLTGAFGPHLFSSTQVERGKPAPDLFLFAAARMGVDPARCVVIEDSTHGVAGARAAGMTAIGFAGGSHAGAGHARRLSAAGAAHAASSWDDVLQHLAA